MKIYGMELKSRPKHHLRRRGQRPGGLSFKFIQAFLPHVRDAGFVQAKRRGKGKPWIESAVSDGDGGRAFSMRARRWMPVQQKREIEEEGDGERGRERERDRKRASEDSRGR